MTALLPPGIERELRSSEEHSPELERLMRKARDASDFLKALAHESRLLLLCLLAETELARGNVAEARLALGDAAALVATTGNALYSAEAARLEGDLALLEPAGPAGRERAEAHYRRAIGLARDAVDAERALYLVNALTWRAPVNRDPSPEAIALSLPFLRRHVELARPEVIVLCGNIACEAALGRRSVQRLRGQWTEAFGRPALPMVHPSYLLQAPVAKREAWADLLSLAAWLDGPH